LVEQADGINADWHVSDRAEVVKLTVEPNQTLTASVAVLGQGQQIGTTKRRSPERLAESIPLGLVPSMETAVPDKNRATWISWNEWRAWPEYAIRSHPGGNVQHKVAVSLPSSWDLGRVGPAEGDAAPVDGEVDVGEQRAPKTWRFTQPGIVYQGPGTVGSRVLRGTLYCLTPATLAIDLTLEASAQLLVLPVGVFLDLGERLTR